MNKARLRGFFWSEREDLNLRPLVSQTCAPDPVSAWSFNILDHLHLPTPVAAPVVLALAPSLRHGFDARSDVVGGHVRIPHRGGDLGMIQRLLHDLEGRGRVSALTVCSSLVAKSWRISW